MSISFLPFVPFEKYIGSPYPQPIQVSGKSGYAVRLSYNFLSYGAGSLNPNIVVETNMSGGYAGIRGQLLDRIRSIYIDNTGSALPLFVKFPDTDFTVAAQPYSIGWYPVFTNGFVVQTGIFGFTNVNISSANIYVTNIAVAAFTDSSLQSVMEQNLASPVLASGSSLTSITPIIEGQDYNNGNLSITGGGGNGATALGLLDQWGRFTAIILEDTGSGYTGSPTITPTGGQTIPPAFNPAGTYANNQKLQYNGTEWLYEAVNNVSIILSSAPYNSTTTYNLGNQISYNNAIWYYNNNTPFQDVPTPPNATYWVFLGSKTPQTGQQWLNSGTPSGTLAVFNVTLSAAASLITTSTIGVPALGDQAASYVDIITAGGKFRDNLFGTPYNSGFIYLTHIDVRALYVVGAASWILQNSDGYQPFNFNVQIATVGSAPGVQQLLSLQKMNMKLDATVDWFLTCSSFSSEVILSHGFAWTYSQQ